MDILAYIIFFGIVAVFSTVVVVWRCCENLNSMQELITFVFLGKPLNKVEIALKPDVSPEDLCRPLTMDVLQRVHACSTVKRAKVNIDLLHKIKMLTGIADIVVTYDFEGNDPEGQIATVQETAYLRVLFEDPWNRYGWDTMVITGVERIQPTKIK